MDWAKLLVPFFNVVYVVVALIMVGLILVQRGAGAQAGSGFGSGASGTVFGSQGSANFMSRATAVCAVIFFLISLGMGIYISHGGRPKALEPTSSVMGNFKPTEAASDVPVAAEAPTSPDASSDVPVVTPAAPATDVPSSQSVPASSTPVTPVNPPVAETPAPVPTPN